ncbi:MAG: sensor histidine kinase [Planctomycetota bacterium]|jgi:signal transduction histidine kinase
MVLTRDQQPEANELAGIMQAYHEVTDRLKRSHELLRDEVCRLRDELHEKNRELQRRERLVALGQMAAGVAHEIRNPLGGIRLYTSLLERDLKDRPGELQLAQRINVGVRNLECIVGDILAFAGGSDPKMQSARMGDVIESAVIQAAGRSDELGTQVEIDTGGHEIICPCDAGQIERAVLNVLLNALEAAGRGGQVFIRCELTHARESDEDSIESPGLENRCRITIDDSGPGVDPEVAQRVFNPFYTTKDTGTGLGLAIVHRIIEAHEGVVSVGRREEGGASFALQIPWRRPAESGAEPGKKEGV